jgi:ADP-ribose pyrophosphatase
VDEKTVSSEIVYSGRAVNLRVDTIQTADGRVTTREIVEHSDCVAVVAVDVNENILMVRQYRKSVGKDLLEIPAGGIEPGETPEAAVEREMREETGMQPRRIIKLGGFYSSPGFCTEYLHLYLVSDMIKNPLVAEDTLEIEICSFPKDEILKLIASGQICDSKTIAGLLVYLNIRK